eukprot:334796_1
MAGSEDWLTPYFSECSKTELKTFFTENDVSCLDNFNEADYYPVPICDITISNLHQVTYGGVTMPNPNGNYRLIDDFENGKPYYKQDHDTFLWYDGSEYRITDTVGGGGAPLARCQQNDISLCTTGNWEYWTSTGYEIDSDAELTFCNTITPQPTAPTSTPIPAPTGAPNEPVIDGSLKLSHGTGFIGDNIYKGRVEIYHNDEWGTICNDAADGKDFVVICRQLGYSTVDDYWSDNYDTPFGQGIGSIWLDELACNGRETEVIQCVHDGWGIQDCDHYEDISVSCKDPILINPITQNGDIRLVDGLGSVGDIIYEGRVEIYYDDIWGTICNDNVDIEEFNVICRQLGYSRVNMYSNSGSDTPYGEGIGLIWLDELVCTGSETAIIECGHDIWGTHDCGHDEDISVSCTDPISTPIPTDITQIPTPIPTPIP